MGNGPLIFALQRSREFRYVYTLPYPSRFNTFNPFPLSAVFEIFITYTSGENKDSGEFDNSIARRVYK